MQPACLDLPIIQGTTYRDTVRLMQPAFVYLPITAITASESGVRLTVEHGLAGDWPVWVRGVTGMPDLNRDPRTALPWRAKRIDASTLEINALSGAGLQPRGGELVYKLPVDLDGATISARLLDASGALLLAIPAAVIGRGTVELELTDEQTAALSLQVASWTLDVEQGGDVYRAITGQARVWPAGSLPPCDGNGWITVGGSQGPRGADGATVTAAEVDPDGYLVLTMSDHSVIRSESPVDRPWGAISGDITAQADLMQLLGDLEDSIPTNPADIGAATAAQGALADTAVQPGDLSAVATSNDYADLDNLPTLGTAAATDAADYATAAQGALAGTAVQPGDIVDVVRDDDTRLTDSRAPTGGAGGVLSGSYPNPGFAVDMATQAELDSGLAGKVDKVAGKQLSTEDYTTAEKNKLAGIEAGAQVNSVTSVAGKTGAVTLAKGDVGLGNVDNTSDAAKPVSTAQQAALNLKLDATATAADSSKLGGQLPSYYATAAQGARADSAVQPADLANAADPAKGAALIGYDNRTVAAVLDEAKIKNSSARFEGTATDDAGTPDAVFRVHRTHATTTSPHGFRDQTIFDPAAGARAACAFDAAITSAGSRPLDHVIGFQSRNTHAGTGALSVMYGGGSMNVADGPITAMYGHHSGDRVNAGRTVGTVAGFYYRPAVNGTVVNAFGSVAYPAVNAGGSITNYTGFRVESGNGVGTITNEFGFYCKNLTKGTNRYPLYIEDTTGRNYIGARTQINQTLEIGGNERLAIGGSTSSDYPAITYNYDPRENKLIGNSYSSGFVWGINNFSFRHAAAGTAGATPSFATLLNIRQVSGDDYGALFAGSDNTQRLGLASSRWSEVYAGTGTISTSDAREKEQVRELSEQERALAAELKSMIRAFKWRNAVEKKGDGARWHFGVIAQDVVAAFERHGLDATEYGAVCYDEWKNDDGEIEGRYGVRYDQLLALIISAL